MLNVKELAKKNYPTYWDINRLVNLVEAGKLTKADYKEITGFTYPATEYEVQYENRTNVYRVW